MINKAHGWKKAALVILLLVWCCSVAALAEGLSGDNSLSSLGITTEGVTVSPEFLYSTIEYNVTVPAGTTELSLDPVTSNASATITDISGTTLDENGEGTVVITVMAENGSAVSYYLYVKREEAAVQTEAQTETEKETEPPTEKETEPETEDPRYVKVDRNSLEEAENTIANLKSETANFRDRQNFLMKILYGLIAFCVVLLFVVINLILKKRDLKKELQAYRDYGFTEGDQAERQMQGYVPQDGGAGDYGMQQDGQDIFRQQNDRNGYERQYVPDGNEVQSDRNGYQDGFDVSWDGQDGQPGWESKAEGQVTFRSGTAALQNQQAAPAADDPSTVPKPSRAKKKPKKMPEYQQPQPTPEYQPHPTEDKKDVEVTMIDL